jgi:type IV pilus assembly protein PilW
MNHKQTQSGISLVELLIGIFIGSLLLIGLIQVITNSGRSYGIQDSTMRMQENGQFAIEQLAMDLRNVGFFGCLPSHHLINNQLNTLSPFFNFMNGIEGTSDNQSNMDLGSDTLTLRGAAHILGGRSLQPPLPSVVTDPISVGPNSGIQVGDLILVSDCESGDIFQVTGMDANGLMSHGAGMSSPGNTSGALSKVYRASAFLYQPYVRSYDIRFGVNGIPTLFMTDKQGSQALVPGIENMVVWYGEDTDNDGVANRYVRANQVVDMNRVVSVRISLLAQTIENNVSEVPVPYEFNQQVITPTDHRLRRVYTSTIMLRNRGV